MTIEELSAEHGIMLDERQITRIRDVFKAREMRDPDIFELRMILEASHTRRTEIPNVTAPTEITTKDKRIMDAWADAMALRKRIRPQAERPCTIGEVLELLSPTVQKDTVIPSSYAELEQLTADGYVSAGRLLRDGDNGITGADENYASVSVKATVNTPSYDRSKYERSYFDRSKKDKSQAFVLMIAAASHLDALEAFFSDKCVAASVTGAITLKNTSLPEAIFKLSRGADIDTRYIREDAPDEILHSLIAHPTVAEHNILISVPYALCSELRAHAQRCGIILLEIGRSRSDNRLSIISHKNGSTQKIADMHASTLFCLQRITTRKYTLNVENAEGYTRSADISCGQCVFCPVDGSDSITPSDGAVIIPRAGVALSSASCQIGTDIFADAAMAVFSAAAPIAALGIEPKAGNISLSITASAPSDQELLLSAISIFSAAYGLEAYIPNRTLTIDATSPSRLSVTAHASLLEQRAEAKPPSESQNAYLLIPCPDTEANGKELIGLLSYVAKKLRSGELSRAFPLLGQVPRKLLESHKIVLNDDVTGGLLDRKVPLGFIALSPLPQNTDNSTAQGQILGITLGHATVSLDTQRREKTMNTSFEPLCKNPRTVILDTDIGPDCDDVGALATLIYYSKQYGFDIAGICNCTSNPAGNGVVDAVCKFCGITTPPMGKWNRTSFYDSEEHCKYNREVAHKFSDDYRNGNLAVESPVPFYRHLLANAPDRSIMLITIGMFNNIAALIDSPADDISPLDGKTLLNTKVYSMVSMATAYPAGREFNITCDAAASRKVFENVTFPIYLSDFNIGATSETLFDGLARIYADKGEDPAEKNPIYLSYLRFTGDKDCRRPSFDLTAVQFAVLGVGEYYGLVEESGRLEFYAETPESADDATRFVPDKDGNCRYIKKNTSDRAVAAELERIIESLAH